MPIAGLRRKDPNSEIRKRHEDFGKLLRNRYYPFLIVLRREPRLVFTADAKRGILKVAQIDISLPEKAEFLFAQSRKQERGKRRFLEYAAGCQDPVQFILAIRRGTALCFEVRALERFEFRTWARNGQVPFAHEEVEKRAQNGDLVIDSAGREKPVRVLTARFAAPDSFVIVDVWTGDCPNEHLATEDALQVVERGCIALYGTRFVRRVHTHVIQEECNSAHKECELRLRGLAWCDPGRFASPLFSFPSFHEVAAWPLVPHITRTCMSQRNEVPLAVLIANLLDDLNRFRHRHIRPIGV